MSAFLTRQAQKAKWLILLLSILVARPCRAGPAPVILVQPLSLSVLNLDIATFTVVASSGTTMTYQWYKDGNLIPDATSASYTILSVTAADSGRYYVKVTNVYGSKQSVWATLTVVSAPLITAQPVSQIATQGQAASFSVNVAANPSPGYQWFFNGAALHGGGSRNSTLNLSSVDWTNSGTYTVVVTNSYGSVTSTPATLTVVGNLPVTLTNVATPILGSGAFTFQFSVQPGFTYVVMASADLVKWTPIATNVAQANTVLFTDPATSNFPSRFYRIALQ
jgi:membrane carboxypeptidase/penicillin-binding protein PbpC